MVRPLRTEFVGDRAGLFRFGMKLSALTVLTLGLYRFWMKTRLRRWYWSAIRPGGHPMEYVGDPLEKLLGFLIAVVFLAFYIGIFNLILMFLSFSLWEGNFVGYAASFIVIIPVLFFAKYRARRYLLARTRWRGIRFGLEPAAWRYSMVAMVLWAITLLSAGALWPLMTFHLEKFRTNRTWFGSAKLSQGGRWYKLIVPATPALMSLWISLGLVAGFGATEDPAFIGGLFLSLPALGVFWVYYRVAAFRYLQSNKMIGDDVAMTATPRFWRIFRIYVWGNVAVGFILGIVASVVFFVLVVILLILGFSDDLSDAPVYLAFPLGLLGYFAVFVFWDVLTQVFVRMPLLAHYAESIGITDPMALSALSQRDRDAVLDAGGFAEALDVGAAI